MSDASENVTPVTKTAKRTLKPKSNSMRVKKEKKHIIQAREESPSEDFNEHHKAYLNQMKDSQLINDNVVMSLKPIPKRNPSTPYEAESESTFLVKTEYQDKNEL